MFPALLKENNCASSAHGTSLAGNRGVVTCWSCWWNVSFGALAPLIVACRLSLIHVHAIVIQRQPELEVDVDELTRTLRQSLVSSVDRR